MRALIYTIDGLQQPEAVVEALRRDRSVDGVILLRTALFNTPEARYSYLVANPFLTFRSYGPRCELSSPATTPTTLFGNPWDQLQALLSRYELLDDVDLPFPLGGCFGFFGYDLKNFVEPKLPRSTIDDLDIADSFAGFYSSVLVFDHQLQQTTIISTGLIADGTRSQTKAQFELNWWKAILDAAEESSHRSSDESMNAANIRSNMTRAQYEQAVERAIEYIRQRSNAINEPYLLASYALTLIELRDVARAKPVVEKLRTLALSDTTGPLKSLGLRVRTLTKPPMPPSICSADGFLYTSMPATMPGMAPSILNSRPPAVKYARPFTCDAVCPDSPRMVMPEPTPTGDAPSPP